MKTKLLWAALATACAGFVWSAGGCSSGVHVGGENGVGYRGAIGKDGRLFSIETTDSEQEFVEGAEAESEEDFDAQAQAEVESFDGEVCHDETCEDATCEDVTCEDTACEDATGEEVTCEADAEEVSAATTSRSAAEEYAISGLAGDPCDVDCVFQTLVVH